MASIQRTGARDTQALIAALAPLAEYGLSPEEAAVVGFGRFPVAGEATYSHDWSFPRFGPGWRLHQGTDIFAVRGLPVRAPDSGSVRIRNGGLGGLSAYVTTADGTYCYLAHLAGIAPGLVDGATVGTGDVVGYVGDSGKARGGLPHVHFEVHPGGGGPVDPKSVLDRYLNDAIAAAPDVVAAYAQAEPDASGNPEPVVAEPPAVDAAAFGHHAQRPALGRLDEHEQWRRSAGPGQGAAGRRADRLGPARGPGPHRRAGPVGRPPGRPLAARPHAAAGGGPSSAEPVAAGRGAARGLAEHQ